MRSDQVFVLLLIILIPLTGCFENGVGDADAQDATEENETNVINNYYNNTTTILQQEPQLHHVNANTTTDIAFQISIGEDEALEIIDTEVIIVWNESYSNNDPERYSIIGLQNLSCDDGFEHVSHYSQSVGFLWRGTGECIYTFGPHWGENFGTAYYSVFYKIHPLV